jgi:general secretion pathway protein D
MPGTEPKELRFSNMPVDLVLEDYSRVTGRTLLQHPQVPKVQITLKSQGVLDPDEYLQAIETVLGMNGIGLVPVGDSFLKIVPIASIRQEGQPIVSTTPTNLLNGHTGEMVSQMITVNYVDLAEARKVIDHLKHPFAQVQNFDRNNCMLVTDTADNVNRILQVLKVVDQPAQIQEEPHIIQVRHTKASEIKRKLEEIIAEQQKAMEGTKPSTVPRMSPTGAPSVAPPAAAVPGVIRARPPVVATPPATETAAVLEAMAEVERGIIQGPVRMVADDRTNILILITRPVNMKFFDRIVSVLDVETAPEVEVRVFRLEFAAAKDIAGMLNELIGVASKQDAAASKPAQAGAPPDGGDSRSTALREIEQRIAAAAATQPTAAGKSKIGELSKENIKILSDERTNSLLIMASRRDLATLDEIIRSMDMMLSQVLIEAVIVDVKLSDEMQSGVDWIQRSLIAYEKGADGTRNAKMAFQGRFGGGQTTPLDATGKIAFPTGGGLSYYFTFFGLNIDTVLQMVSKDSRSRVVSTPVILTTDNKEAKITSTDQIYVYSGQKYDQYQNPYADYTTKDVGLTLTVKPHINENKFVMMDISQTMSEPGLTGAPQSGAKVSSQRTVNASIAVRDRQTIVLGGQVREERGRSRTKVPLLGDIPLLGKLFSYTSGSQGRLETVVFVTPYVLDDMDSIRAETLRRSRALTLKGSVTRGWSSDEPLDGDEEAKVVPTPSVQTNAAAVPAPSNVPVNPEAVTTP